MDSTQSLAAGVPDLIDWFEKNKRPLPWRKSPSPYHVWVSEIMLQQTRIEAVIPYFERFMTALPTVQALAEVPEDALMKLWEGLGYYSRARNLQKAARQMAELYSGELPADYTALLSLPGIGEYTAGAVASIAYNIPVPAVDGNVLRVLARLTANREDITRPAVKKQFQTLAASLLPPDRPGAFNQALMELGERVCLPNTIPRCETCPVRAVCAGHAAGIAAELPVRAPKKPRRIEEHTVLVAISNESVPRVLLHRRPAEGLLAGLWELPNLPGHIEPEKAAELLQTLGGSPAHYTALEPGKHIFTHVEWHMIGYRVSLEWFEPPTGYVWVNLRQLAEEYALPTAFRLFSRLLPVLMKGEEA